MSEVFSHSSLNGWYLCNSGLTRISLSLPVGSIFAASHAGNIPHSYVCDYSLMFRALSDGD